MAVEIKKVTDTSTQDAPLLNLTKLLLVIWAVITIPAGLLLTFYAPFAPSFLYPSPPMETLPQFFRLLIAAFDVGTGIASVLAFRENRWSVARPIIAIYLAFDVISTYGGIAEVADGRGSLQLWAYLTLGIIYFLVGLFVW